MEGCDKFVDSGRNPYIPSKYPIRIGVVYDSEYIDQESFFFLTVHFEIKRHKSMTNLLWKINHQMCVFRGGGK